MGVVGYIKSKMNNSYVFALFRKAVVMLSSVICTALLARYLGPELKGQYSTLLAWLNIIVIICQFGFYHLYSNYKKRKILDADSLFFSLLTIKFVVLFVLAFVVTIVIYISQGICIQIMLPIMIVFNTYQAENIFMVLIDNLRRQNIITIAVALINVLSMLFIFFTTRKNIYYALIIFVLKDILTSVFSIIWMHYQFVWDKRVKELFFETIKIVKYPVMASLLVEMNYRVDVLLLEKMSTYYLVGLYSAGVNLAEMAWLFPDVFKEILFHKTANKDATEDIKFSLRFSNTIILFFIIAILLIGKMVIRIFFGIDYLDSYRVTIWIFFGIPGMAIFKVLNPLYQAMGKWKLYVGALAVGVVTNVGLDIILIPMLNMYGAAIASAVSYSLCGGILLNNFCKEYHCSPKEVFFLNKEDVQKGIRFLKN